METSNIAKVDIGSTCESKRYLTPKQASKLFPPSAYTFRKYARMEILPSKKVNERIYFDRVKLEAHFGGSDNSPVSNNGQRLKSKKEKSHV